MTVVHRPFLGRPSARPSSLRGLSLLPLLALVACGGVPRRTFEIRAIDPEERPVACLVVVDDRWDTAAAQKRITNGNGGPLRVEVEFPRPEVGVTLVPVQIDVDTNEVMRMPTNMNDAYEHHAEARFLRVDDPPRQLFILERR